MQLRTTAVLLLVASLVLACVAVVGSVWAERTASQSAEKEYRYLLADMVEGFDNSIASYRSYAVQLGGSTWVKQIAYMQGDTVDTRRVSNMQLCTYATDMKLYAESCGAYKMGLIFMDKSLALMDGYSFGVSFLTRNILRVEGMADTDWMQCCRSAAKAEEVLFPNLTMHYYDSSFQGMLMMFQVCTEMKSDACALFVVLREKELSQCFSAVLERSDPLSLSIAQEGAEPFMTLGNVIDNAKSLTQVSEETGLIFTLRIPQRVVLPEIIAGRNKLLAIVGVLWLIVMILAPFVTKRVFKPLRQLINLVGGETETPLRRDINEFDALREGISAIKRQEEAMNRELSLRSVYLRNAEIERMLLGLAPEEGQGRRLDEFVREFSGHAFFRAALICWRSREGVPSASVIEERLCGIPDVEIAVLRKSGSHILAAGYNRKEDFENIITALLENWATCYVAIGSEETALEAIHTSYETAQEANNYRTVSEGFRVLHCDSVQKNLRYYLPQNSESQLLNFVAAGQGDKAVETFRTLYETNKNEKGTTFAGMENFLSNVSLSVLRSMPEGNEFAILPTGDDPDAMRLAVEDNIRRAAAFSTQKQQEMPTRMEAILAYVTANLTDATLSLEMVADHFGVSTSLISRLFTEQYGENFHAFVNRQRISLATDTISRGSADLTQIALDVGYTNDVTFRRMFKRFVGMTPSAYRMECNTR